MTQCNVGILKIIVVRWLYAIVFRIILLLLNYFVRSLIKHIIYQLLKQISGG